MTSCCGDCRGPGNVCCVTQCAQTNPCPHVPKLESVYCPQVCLCGDEASYIDYRNYCAKKDEIPSSNSLGSPVGIVRALNTPKSDVTPTEWNMQRFACCLKGFAHLILLPETEWNPAVLSYIMKEGLKLYADSKKIDERNENSEEMVVSTTIKPIQQSSIYTANELKIVRSFELLNCLFDIELGQKFELDQHKNRIVIIENLLAALRAYFKIRNYCLIEANGQYMLVWHKNRTIFALDFSGRYMETLQIDRDGGGGGGSGYAVLICLRRLENLYHLIAHLSGHQAKDVCTIREIKVTKLIHPNGQVQSTGYEERQNEFVIVSPDYAYLISRLHLSYRDAAERPLRMKSALPIGVAAILASKIDHPATWTKYFLKKIFCYGVNVCIFCWERCLQYQEHADWNSFPNRFQMGQFLVRFNFKPKQYTGHWKCIPNYEKVELMRAIVTFFKNDITKLLIDIDRQVYAVWKKNDFIYLLDPYRHKLRSLSDDIFDSSSSEQRSASLRIFRSLDIFLFTFHQMLLENNRKSEFFIHTLKIKKIELCQMDQIDIPDAAEELPSDGEDTMSLNETICFVEPDRRCLEQLEQTSEDEPEDDLEEEEVIESEPEHPGEEEGNGEAGDE